MLRARRGSRDPAGGAAGGPAGGGRRARRRAEQRADRRATGEYPLKKEGTLRHPERSMANERDDAAGDTCTAARSDGRTG